MTCPSSASASPEAGSPRRRPAAHQTIEVHRPDETRVKVYPGGYYVGYGEARIETTLGSCVAACARDPVAGVGGINHFMLPLDTQPETARWAASRSTRYGVHAMEMLINAILKRGGERHRLQFKLFGGGKVVRNMNSDIGARNIDFVRQFIATEGLTLISEDLGDTVSRRLIYCVRTGRAQVRRMAGNTPLIDERDRTLIEALKHQPAAGDVELFD